MTSSPRRVLMVSPHFPPDSSAASHRVRLLAPYLEEHGWEPTVVTVRPDDYEARRDDALAAMVPESLDVVRVAAWSSTWTRYFGFGDLGVRAFAALSRKCRELAGQTRYDCLFVTIFPSYPALLGPLLKRALDLAFVLDYQDPWVGAWGLTAGPAAGGTPDLKSRMSRFVASRLEPIAVRAADAVTAVSEATYRDVQQRNPDAASTPCAEIPLGGDANDFRHLSESPSTNRYFDAGDGAFHLSYVGTLLPKGFETARAFLASVALLKQRDPETYRRLRVHFFGTSNQSVGSAHARVLPDAERLGVGDVVDEIPERIDYLDALSVLTHSSAILLMGSSERHYTASKLYPALLARRPLLAAYHEQSTVVSILKRAAPTPWGRLVTYDDDHRASSRIEALYEALHAVVTTPPTDASLLDLDVVQEFSARAMAGRLAAVFDLASATNGGRPRQ
jgi:glycosyltransferase involved in cell wall biosynthesis